MSSFFEKLKKGMGIQELEDLAEEKEEKEEEAYPVKVVPKKRKSAEVSPKKTRAKKPLEEKKKIEIAEGTPAWNQIIQKLSNSEITLTDVQEKCLVTEEQRMLLIKQALELGGESA